MAFSTVGRPRKATQAQVEIILEWRRNRKTLAQLARELGLSQSTVENVLRQRGKYKQPPPEERVNALRRRAQTVRALRQEGYC
jgi:transposase